MLKSQILLFIVACLFGGTQVHANTPAPNVILITLDGVRWQDVFRGEDPGLSTNPGRATFPKLHSTLSTQGGFIFGDRDRGSPARIRNPFGVSLPGYQEIFAGSPQWCRDNDCGRIRNETFPERLVREAKFPSEAVAAVSSWQQIPLAWESQVGVAFSNAGHLPLPWNDLNGALITDRPPWEFEARWDRHTWALSMSYLDVIRPRFLFVSLNDSDAWAHNDKYSEYADSLRMYDGWIQDLQDTLAGMGSYGQNTWIFVTTDHGRGNSKNWAHHAMNIPGSHQIWMAVLPPLSIPRPLSLVDHTENTPTLSHLRPTIERLFGLKPRQCPLCVDPIPEIADRVWP